MLVCTLMMSCLPHRFRHHRWIRPAILLQGHYSYIKLIFLTYGETIDLYRSLRNCSNYGKHYQWYLTWDSSFYRHRLHNSDVFVLKLVPLIFTCKSCQRHQTPVFLSWVCLVHNHDSLVIYLIKSCVTQSNNITMCNDKHNFISSPYWSLIVPNSEMQEHRPINCSWEWIAVTTVWKWEEDTIWLDFIPNNKKN